MDLGVRLGVLARRRPVSEEVVGDPALEEVREVPPPLPRLWPLLLRQLFA